MPCSEPGVSREGVIGMLYIHPKYSFPQGVRFKADFPEKTQCGEG